MRGLPEIIDDHRRRIAELERRLRSQSRIGVVTEVDAGNGTARVKLQDGDQPFLTGWIPWVEPSAGANKTHNPPSVGQQVQIASESGDLHDAVIQGSLNSDANGRPSGAGDEYVMLSVGAAKITVTGGGTAIVFSVGGYSLTLSSGGATNSGGALTHDGKDIGKTHTHGGVLSGPADTQPPN
ncbi:phage baseplate assembly protein V [Sulfitobacter faviae]|uniref:Phage baseplate assembly protein V n=1 Tax=Sulfitobacter faviae TaxID=1775881 RepID=A0ABZ0V315_9RHOB|nr:phage baseplate assembly protein V [Sulfitobacter faviae]WPZ23109.1 phage baseplate assembly protein V [Sulfitobacter faviae]